MHEDFKTFEEFPETKQYVCFFFFFSKGKIFPIHFDTFISIEKSNNYETCKAIQQFRTLLFTKFNFLHVCQFFKKQQFR